MRHLLSILLLTLLASLSLQAQTKVYPIKVTISGNSDISASLSDLCSPTSTLMFTFQCLDRNETNLPVAVKVRLYPASGRGNSIENKIQTGLKTFDIGYGQSIIEQKLDLEKYFLPNFNNANQSSYYQNGQLVEGNYILQVVCYDARTISRQISNDAKMYLHIDQFNYPTLQFPVNNSDLEQYTTKPTISFQWLRTGKTDPKIRYRFELWEVINATTVETYVKQNNPIFVDDDIFVTQKSYMPELLQLKIGQKYCWRVTAYDDDHKLPFKRDGESDVFQFQYLNPPVPVSGLKNKVTGKQIKYTWTHDNSHTKYIVEYYDYKRDTTISATQQENSVLLTAPDYDYRIKLRVKAVCYNDMNRISDFSPWSEAYVQPEKKVDFECGKQFPDREIANQELKTTFFEGEIVESKNGDSRYEIIKATAKPDGSLDGKFYAIMDCWSGAKILCDFWDTKINTDNIILTTRYRSEDIPGFVADPEEIKKYVHELVNNAHMAATDNKIRDTILINQKFDYLYAENGRLKAVVIDKNGEPQVTDVTPDKPYSQSLITDGQGDTLVVSKKGQVMGVKEYIFAGDDRHLLNEYHRQLDSLGEWIVQFDAFDKQVYGFDKVSNKKGIYSGPEYYPYLSDNYDLRYKSVESGTNDKVKVDFGSYPQADSVIFKDKYGVTLKLSKGNILNFTGTSQADTNYIYAYRGDKKIGKLMLNVYKRKPIKVCLVMVNGAHHKESFKEIKESLDKVFLPAVVEFEILSDKIEIPNLTSFSHGGSGVLTVYNDDQKKVLQAYEKEKKMTDGVYYLFFIDNVTDKKDGSGTPVSGYMPRGYNAGFIYDGGSPHTIAHELGHGIGNLEHVFENSNNSGKTANLMDYANGEELWHFQWDQIQDPSRKIFKWWQNEEDAESLSKEYVETDNQDGDIFTFKDTKQLTFLSPGRMPITLPPNYTSFSFVSSHKFCPDGVLTKFTTEDGNYYGHYSISNDKTSVKFWGYVKILNPKALTAEDMYAFEDEAKTKKVYYKDVYSKELTPDQNILFGFKESSHIDLYQLPYSKLDLTDAQQNEISQSDYTAEGLCTLDGFDYEFTDFGWHPFDNEVSFKTDYARNFYEKVIEKHKLSEMSIDEKNILWRIAKIFDNLLSDSNLSPDEFNKFTNVVTLDYLCDNTLWTLDDYIYFEKKLDIFFNELTGEKQGILEDFIKSGNLQRVKQKENDVHNTEITTMSDTDKFFFWQYYIHKYGKLADYSTLLHIIKSISNITMSIVQEFIVLEAIKCIRESDYDQFIADLQKDNLFGKLAYHIDNANYVDFICSICAIYQKTYLGETKIQSADNTTFIWIEGVDILADFESSDRIVFSEQTTKSTILSTSFGPFSSIYDIYQTAYNLIELDKKYEYNPFDYVYVVFDNVPSFLEKKIQPGTKVMLPAFLFSMICNTQYNLTLVDNISDLFIICSAVVGAYQLSGITGISKSTIKRAIVNQITKEARTAFTNTMSTRTSFFAANKLAQTVSKRLSIRISLKNFEKIQAMLINTIAKDIIEASGEAMSLEMAKQIAAQALQTDLSTMTTKALAQSISTFILAVVDFEQYIKSVVGDLGAPSIGEDYLFNTISSINDRGGCLLMDVLFEAKFNYYSVFLALWSNSANKINKINTIDAVTKNQIVKLIKMSDKLPAETKEEIDASLLRIKQLYEKYLIEFQSSQNEYYEFPEN